MKLKLAKGFTLAEVLVTLGIIGVISAMTLPTLVKNHQRQVYVTQLQKVVNELSQAIEQIITDSNSVNINESKLGTLGANGAKYFLQTYFKTVQICNVDEPSACFTDAYKNLNGSAIRLRNFIPTGGNQNYSSCAVLTSGPSICLGYINSAYSVLVDVNGKQGPNILGRDLFDFFINNDGLISVGMEVEEIANDFSTNCAASTSISGNYGACFAKILNDGWKMDY